MRTTSPLTIYSLFLKRRPKQIYMLDEFPLVRYTMGDHFSCAQSEVAIKGSKHLNGVKKIPLEIEFGF